MKSILIQSVLVLRGKMITISKLLEEDNWLDSVPFVCLVLFHKYILVKVLYSKYKQFFLEPYL